MEPLFKVVRSTTGLKCFSSLPSRGSGERVSFNSLTFTLSNKLGIKKKLFAPHKCCNF